MNLLKIMRTSRRLGTGLLDRQRPEPQRSEAATQQEEGYECDKKDIVDKTGRK